MNPYNEEDLAKMPRKTAAQIISESRIGELPGGVERLAIAVEIALNQEWWRGKYAGLNEPKPSY